MVCVLITWLKHNEEVISHGTILINLLVLLSLATAFGKGKEDGRLGSKVTEVRKNRNKNDHIAMGSYGHQYVYTGKKEFLIYISEGGKPTFCCSKYSRGLWMGSNHQLNHHNRFLKYSVDENKYKIVG